MVTRIFTNKMYMGIAKMMILLLFPIFQIKYSENPMMQIDIMTSKKRNLINDHKVSLTLSNE